MIVPESKIGIIGCGKMGRDIFNFLTQFPFRLTLICKSESAVNLLKDEFIKQQNRRLKYGLIDSETFNFRKAHTNFTTSLSQLKNAGLIIESVTEELELKRKLFIQAQKIIAKDCIIATNSSSISPDHLFAEISGPERGLGLHFFYPIAQKDIVEVNLAKMTSEKTLSIANFFLQEINKFHITLSYPHHFIMNRIFLRMQAGCGQLLDDGVASVDEIDGLIKSRLFPVGVFEFFDHVGNDVMLESVHNYLIYESDQDFFRPLLKILEQKVQQGELGVKSNVGFYKYPAPLKNQITETLNQPKLLKRITHWYLDGVYHAHRFAGLSKRELEHIVKEYMLIEKSPFELASEVGYTPK